MISHLASSPGDRTGRHNAAEQVLTVLDRADVTSSTRFQDLPFEVLALLAVDVLRFTGLEPK